LGREGEELTSERLAKCREYKLDIVGISILLKSDKA